MFVFQSDKLVPRGYTKSNFQSHKDSRRSTFNFVFTSDSATISRRNLKQSCIVDSIMEVEYVTTSKATKEFVWLRKFLLELRVAPLLYDP